VVQVEFHRAKPEQLVKQVKRSVILEMVAAVVEGATGMEAVVSQQMLQAQVALQVEGQIIPREVPAETGTASHQQVVVVQAHYKQLREQPALQEILELIHLPLEQAQVAVVESPELRQQFQLEEAEEAEPPASLA
jgi:sulfur carrier protein ThiS